MLVSIKSLLLIVNGNDQSKIKATYQYHGHCSILNLFLFTRQCPLTGLLLLWLFDLILDGRKKADSFKCNFKFDAQIKSTSQSFAFLR